METKVVILNSKILENLITTSLRTKFGEDIIKLRDQFKLASGTVKMKLFKVMVEKMNCIERPVYYANPKDEDFSLLPSREFFREFYDDLDILFDYHVDFKVSQEEEANDFKIVLRLEWEEKPLINMHTSIRFSGGEMSGKLSSKWSFELVPDFNLKMSKS
jgi:hypothetical protein